MIIVLLSSKAKRKLKPTMGRLASSNHCYESHSHCSVLVACSAMNCWQPLLGCKIEWSWFYLAIIALLQEKQISARTPGHWKNWKVVELMPFNCWVSFVSLQFQLVVLYIPGKEPSDDEHSWAGSAGSQPVSLGGTGAQICKDLGVAEKV